MESIQYILQGVDERNETKNMCHMNYYFARVERILKNGNKGIEGGKRSEKEFPIDFVENLEKIYKPGKEINELVRGYKMVKTKAGKLRLWLRIVFKRGKMALYLEKLCREVAIVQKYYSKGAFLLERDKVDDFLQMCSAIDSIKVKLSFKDIPYDDMEEDITKVREYAIKGMPEEPPPEALTSDNALLEIKLAEIEVLTQVLKAKDMEEVDLKEKIAKLEGMVEEMEAEKVKMGDEHKALERMIEVEKQEKEFTAEQLKKKVMELEVQYETVGSLRQELATWRGVKKGIDETTHGILEEHHTDLEGLQKYNATLRKQLGEAFEGQEQYRVQLEKVTELYVAEQSALADMKAVNESLSHQLSDVGQQLLHAQHEEQEEGERQVEKAALEAEMTQTLQAYEGLREESERKGEEVEGLLKEVTMWKGQVEVLKGEKERLVEEMNALTLEGKSQEHMVTLMKEKMEHQKAELVGLQVRREEWEKQREVLEEEMREMGGREEREREERERLEGRVVEMEGAYEEMRKEKEEKEGMLMEVSVAYEEVKKEYEEMRESYEEVKGKYAQYQQEMKVKIEDVDIERGEMRKQIRELERREREAGEVKEILESQVKEQGVTLEVRSQELSVLKQRYEKLKGDHGQLQERLLSMGEQLASELEDKQGRMEVQEQQKVDLEETKDRLARVMKELSEMKDDNEALRISLQQTVAQLERATRKIPPRFVKKIGEEEAAAAPPPSSGGFLRSIPGFRRTPPVTPMK